MGAAGFVARLGGDEFCFVLIGMNSQFSLAVGFRQKNCTNGSFVRVMTERSGSENFRLASRPQRQGCVGICFQTQPTACSYEEKMLLKSQPLCFTDSGWLRRPLSANHYQVNTRGWLFDNSFSSYNRRSAASKRQIRRKLGLFIPGRDAKRNSDPERSAVSRTKFPFVQFLPKPCKGELRVHSNEHEAEFVPSETGHETCRART